jgi:hypothetical protein
MIEIALIRNLFSMISVGPSEESYLHEENGKNIRET